jgi:hypothetical protein
MKTRHGCLAGLLAVAVVGTWGTWVTTAGRGEDSGGRLAFGLFFGLVVVYVGSILEWLTTRKAPPPNSAPPPPRHTGEG